MNHSSIRKALVLSVLSAMPLMADNEAQIRNLENRVNALEQRKGSSGVILPSAGANLDNDIGLGLDVEFLYWKAHVPGIPFAQAIVQQNNGDFVPSQMKEMHWKFRPGVRAGFALRPDHDNWQINTVWTYLYTKASGSSSVSSPNYLNDLYDGSQVDLTTTGYPNANAHWRLCYNNIDINIERAFYVSKWLSFKPMLGLRTTWAREKSQVNMLAAPSNTYGTININHHLRSQFWGIGPNAALNTRWGLGSGFSIFGDAGFALLWGFTEASNRAVVPQYSSGDYFNESDAAHFTAPIVDLAAGLEWNKNFYDNQYHINFRAGWEQHVLFDVSAKLDAVGDAMLYNNLSLQGLTLSAGFDF